MPIGNREESASPFGLTRRSFLKTTTAVAATGLLGGTLAGCSSDAQELEAVSEQVFSGVCRGNDCAGCHFKLTVRDGKLVKTTFAEMADPRYNRICSKGISHVQRVYNPNRVKYPMKRVGERGSGEWQQITWEEAIDEICSTWKDLQSKHGDAAIGFSAGSGNLKLQFFDYYGKLQRLIGGTCVNSGYDHNLARMMKVMGNGEYYTANSLTDLVNAQTIVVWGANPTTANIQDWHFFAEAKKAGARIVVIDPNFMAIGDKADKFVSIRPGTDGALAMGMINYIVSEGLDDEAFLKRSTVAPFLVKASDKKYLRASDLGIEGVEGNEALVVMGQDGEPGLVADVKDPLIHGTFTVSGIEVTTAYDIMLAKCAEWTLEKTSEVCDVAIDDIIEVALMFTEGPTSMSLGLGLDHWTVGHYTFHDCIALSAVTGNMGKPGAGCGRVSPGCTGMLNHKYLYPANAKGGPTFYQSLLPEVLKEKHYFGTPIDLKSLLIYGHNPLGNAAGRKDWLEAFDSLDLIVVIDIQTTDTTRYADIVLPVTHWFETDEVYTFGTPFIQLQEKAIEPLCEAKGDAEIVALLAEGMGCGSEFIADKKKLLEVELDSAAFKAMGIDYARLQKEQTIQVNPREYIYGEDGVFNTTTGRVELYFENPASSDGLVWDEDFNVDNERTVHWEPPMEGWPVSVGGYEKNPLADKFPLNVVTERSRMKTHTQFGHNPWLIEIYPEPIVKINPVDAQARGIEEGDYVKVFNDRGYVVVKALVNPGIRPGVLVMTKGFEWDQFKAGHYSDLMSRVYNPGNINQNYFDCLAEVEKWEGEE